MSDKQLTAGGDSFLDDSRGGIKGNQDARDPGGWVAQLQSYVIPCFRQAGRSYFVNDSKYV